MHDSTHESDKISLNAVPNWRMFVYLAIYILILGGSTIWDHYENPAHPIWESFLVFSVFVSVPPIFVIGLNKFSIKIRNKDYALKYFPLIMRCWYVVMAIQILVFIAKLLNEK